MSSRSLTWRRIGVGAVAVATVAAGSPLLLSTAANAAHTATRLTIAQENGRTTAAAGTCTAFTATPTTAQGGPTDAATITVTIAESPNSGEHDVDFCQIDGATADPADDGSPFVIAPNFNTAAPNTSGSTAREYNAGESITDAGNPGPATQPGDDANPNTPDNASSSTTNLQSNPTGVDQATFVTDGRGLVRFGVVGLLPGAAATVNAFVDPDASGDRQDDDNPLNGTEDNVVAAQRTITFTAGGRPGSDAASDAVRFVEVTPEESFAPLGQNPGHVFRARFTNERGDVVGGVSQARIIATAGPSATTSFEGRCDQSDSETGVSECRFTAPQPGTDTVTVFVNQTTGSPTFGLDSNEPRDTATAVTTLAANSNPTAARTIVLTPDQATIQAGQARDFTATVTDATGAPVNGVSVRFDENGPGAFRSPTSSTSATSTVLINTSGAGRATVTFLTSTTDAGTNTITATIATTGTQCTQTGGNCTDSSPLTITAATTSPSPSATPTATVSPTATPTATMSPGTGQTEAGSRYRGLASPVRVLDTRNNRGSVRSGPIVLDLSQRISDPNATSAVLNVTVTNATRRGFLVAYPNNTDKPETSNVNFEQNQTQANEVVVRLGSDRRVVLFVDSASAHVIADLVGSFTTSTGSGVGEVTTNSPVRAFDSRNTANPTRRNEVVVDLTGRIPNGSTDAILNVTVTRTSARGFVTVFPTGTGRPETSNVNFEPRQTQANEVITRVGTGANANRVSFFIDSASAALVVDVVGAVSTTTDGQTFTALASPQRALDTRDNRGTPRGGNINLVLPSSVPANATGVILNVTATNGTRPGFVTVFPGGSTNPGTSNVNFPTNLTQANEVTTGLGPNNDVTLFVGGFGDPRAHVIVDVVGYLTD